MGLFFPLKRVFLAWFDSSVFSLVGSCCGSGGEDELYGELWRACAGPLVEVPKSGNRVYYFPQGHMEQVKFSNFPGRFVLLKNFLLCSCRRR